MPFGGSLVKILTVSFLTSDPHGIVNLQDEIISNNTLSTIRLLGRATDLI